MIEFTAHEKRVFELFGEKDFNSSEAKALRKIIDEFPMLKDVADCKFDPAISQMALVVMANIRSFQNMVIKYHAKPAPDSASPEKEE